MKIKRDELTSTIVVATNSILNSLTSFNFAARFGMATDSVIESHSDMLGHYQKVIDFARANIEYVTDDWRDEVKLTLEEIDEMTQANIELMTQQEDNG